MPKSVQKVTKKGKILGKRSKYGSQPRVAGVNRNLCKYTAVVAERLCALTLYVLAKQHARTLAYAPNTIEKIPVSITSPNRLLALYSGAA